MTKEKVTDTIILSALLIADNYIIESTASYRGWRPYVGDDAKSWREQAKEGKQTPVKSDMALLDLHVIRVKL